MQEPGNEENTGCGEGGPPCLARSGRKGSRVSLQDTNYFPLILFLPKCWAIFGFSIVFRQERNPSLPPSPNRSPRIPIQIHNRSMHISLSSIFVLQRWPDIGKSLQQALNDV